MRGMGIACALVVAATLGASAVTLPACAASAAREEAPTSRTSLTLGEFLERGDGAWFLTGKVSYQIQAMMVSSETSFHNDLEDVSYTVTDDGETVVMRGTLGEMWTSRLSSVLASYTRPDGDALSAADFAERDTFIDIASIPSPNSCLAMHVPLDVTVTVDTAWGDTLHANLTDTDHGEGDYLVCRANEDGTPDLSDVWVVNGAVFGTTYDTAGEAGLS